MRLESIFVYFIIFTGCVTFYLHILMSTESETPRLRESEAARLRESEAPRLRPPPPSWLPNRSVVLSSVVTTPIAINKINPNRHFVDLQPQTSNLSLWVYDLRT